MSDPTLIPYHERPQLPELTCQEDFTFWNTMLDHTLEDFEVKRYIEKSVPQPPLVPAKQGYTQESQKAFDDWKRHRRFILQMMLSSVLTVRKQLELYGFRPDEPDPYVMYRAIFSAYGSISNYRLGKYLTEFSDLEVSHFATPMQFIQTSNDISRKLNGTGYELTDATKSYLLLARLAHQDEAFVEPLKMQVEKGDINYVEVLRQVSRHFSGGLSVDGSVLAPSIRNKSKTLPRGWIALPLDERQKAFKKSFPSALQCDLCQCQHSPNFLWCGSCQLCHPGGEERCYRSNSSRSKKADHGGSGGDGSPQNLSQQPSPKPQTLPRNAATHAIGRRGSGLSEASLSSTSLSQHAQPNKVNTGVALSLPSHSVSREPAPVKSSEVVKDVPPKEQENVSKPSSTFGQPVGKSTGPFSTFGAAQVPVTATDRPRDGPLGWGVKASSQPTAQLFGSSPFSQCTPVFGKVATASDKAAVNGSSNSFSSPNGLSKDPPKSMFFP